MDVSSHPGGTFQIDIVAPILQREPHVRLLLDNVPVRFFQTGVRPIYPDKSRIWLAQFASDRSSNAAQVECVSAVRRLVLVRESY